jgi:hemolysin activation/secretion protein
LRTERKKRRPSGVKPASAAFLTRTGVLAALAACCTPVAAQSYRDVAPSPPPASSRSALPSPPSGPSDASQQIAVASLNGLVFVSADHAQDEATPRDVAAIGLPLLDKSFLDGFELDIHRPLTFERLAQIRRAVVERYRAAGKPLVDVYVPEQDVSNGIVRIDVVEFRTGKVVARGNRHFSDALLVGEMPLKSGMPIREADVATGLATLNANPYRRVDVVYAPGAASNSTDVVLQTDDRLPLRVSTGYNDAGVPQLGRDRFFAGIDYGNLFGLDQQIGYQFTASNDLFGGNPPIDGRPNRARFLAHSFNYAAPLPWADRVELFGVFAQSTPRLDDSFGQTGISAQLSFRYDHRLPAAGAWQQQLQFGYDFKRSDNNLEFGGTQVFNANTHIHQFVIAYDATHPDALGQTHANATLFVSPGHLDGDNEAAVFNEARMSATPRYTYLQLSGQRDLAVGAGFIVYARALVQWTPDTLLPSEELGLGGDDSVRGYEPYVVQGDRGWNLQTELRTPALAFGASGAALQPFLFIDAGHAWNRIDQPAETSNGSLASIGAGVRFQFSRFVSLRGTYGQPLRAAVPNGSKAPLAQVFLVIGS